MALRTVASHTSEVVIDPPVVRKRVTAFRQFGVFAREVVYYAAWAPDLLAGPIDPLRRTLTLRYMGEPVQSATLPPDWRRQADRLLAVLAERGVQHNDIKPSDILVLEGRLHLVDFGWWTPLGVAPPSEWPDTLGSDWRAGGRTVWEFDDRTSLFRSLEAVESGVVLG